jgi:hypothetical protein
MSFLQNRFHLFFRDVYPSYLLLLELREDDSEHRVRNGSVPSEELSFPEDDFPRLKWNTEPSLGIFSCAFIVKNDVLHGVTVATDPLGFQYVGDGIGTTACSTRILLASTGLIDVAVHNTRRKIPWDQLSVRIGVGIDQRRILSLIQVTQDGVFGSTCLIPSPSSVVLRL